MNLIINNLIYWLSFKTSLKPVPMRIFNFLLLLSMSSCSDFVEVDAPKNILISETVFKDPATVESALANIYYRMREESMVSGNLGMTTTLGIYSDELEYYGFDSDLLEVYHHNLVPSNTTAMAWWSQAYNLIYSANDIIKGVDTSDALTADEKSSFKGQALFVRAYFHSLLANVYGDIPYITTTDYRQNNTASRLVLPEVYTQIIADLKTAVTLLENTPSKGSDRVYLDKDVANALLARMYLYTGQWELAADTATQLIAAYALEPDVNKVFLKGSSEAIWQLKPGTTIRNTHEANQLVIRVIPGQLYALSSALLQAFEPGDQRFSSWVGNISDTDHTVTLHFAQKYKALFTETESVEYPIIFRLAEQYLIRAEARAHLGNVMGAQQDINTLRHRAGLPNTLAATQNELLEAVLRERQIELFTEQGQRWFDLKRLNKADAIMKSMKPNWKPTDVRFPIPETELEHNPNLAPQNQGY